MTRILKLYFLLMAIVGLFMLYLTIKEDDPPPPPPPVVGWMSRKSRSNDPM